MSFIIKLKMMSLEIIMKKRFNNKMKEESYNKE